MATMTLSRNWSDGTSLGLLRPYLPDPKSSGLSYEDKEVINWALQKLKPEFRAVLVLRLIDGYSTEETAAVMKVPLGTVLSRLARAQKKMKKILTIDEIEKHLC